LTAYSGVISDAAWIWDDTEYVTQNAVLREPGGLIDIWLDPSATPQYYPIVHSTFWLEARLYGMSPTTPVAEIPTAGFHFVNVLAHFLAALLFWRFLVRLRVSGAWFAAALFALHPVSVESVAWVTERKNVLSLLFAMATAHMWWSWALDRTRLSKLVWCVFFFAIGLLSKSVIASLPAVLFLILLWKRPRDWKAHLAPLGLLLVMGAYAGWRTAMMEVTQVGASGADWDWTIGQRFLLAGKVIWVYLSKILWPSDLMFFYPRWELDTGALLAWLWPITAFGLPILLFVKRKQWGVGALIAFLIYGGVLFPVLGFLNVYPMKFSFVADHFQYHASLAIYALIAVGLTRWVAPRLDSAVPQFSFGVSKVLAAGLLIGLSLLTMGQGHMYANEKVLWETTVADNPHCWVAHHNLGVIHINEGNPGEAAKEYELALRDRRDPKVLRARATLALTDSDKMGGNVELLRSAETDLLEALEQWPDYPLFHITLAEVYVRPQYRNLQKSIHHFEAATRFVLESDLPKLAVENLQKTALTPMRANLARAQHEEGLALAKSGRTEEAVMTLKGAMRWRPDYWPAEVDRLWIRISHQNEDARRPGAAVAAQQLIPRVIQATGGKPIAELLDLGAAAFASQGDFSQAISTAKEALSLAQKAGQQDQVAIIQRHLVEYHARRPYRSVNGLP
jgi:tetratricopeptide (TPR) repeat protein